MRDKRGVIADLADPAPLFAALGDSTRMRIVARLCEAGPLSIVRLTRGARISRQAITKHLRVLESAGIVHCSRTGRESRFEFDPEPMEEMKRYLNLVSEQWDQALSRLKSFVER